MVCFINKHINFCHACGEKDAQFVSTISALLSEVTVISPVTKINPLE